jgi:hypothetical protein
MGARPLALLVAPLLLAGCADLVTPIAHSSRPPDTAVRVTVAQRDVHGTVGLHGVIRYLRVTGPGTDANKELEPDGTTVVHLPDGGDYLAASWTRSCAETCATLRPARHRCETLFSAAAGEVVALAVRFRAGRACVISVSDPT